MEINIQKVLCPVDFSEASEHALRYALAFAQAYDAELQMLHVVEVPFLPSYATAGIPDLSLPVERIQERCKERMDELTAKYAELHAKTSARVMVGTPFVEIIREAKKEECDLIVMGTHGRSGLQHVLIGSVAEKVVRKSPCPVLTVKHPEHEFVMP